MFDVLVIVLAVVAFLGLAILSAEGLGVVHVPELRVRLVATRLARRIAAWVQRCLTLHV